MNLTVVLGERPATGGGAFTVGRSALTTQEQNPIAAPFARRRQMVSSGLGSVLLTAAAMRQQKPSPVLTGV